VTRSTIALLTTAASVCAAITPSEEQDWRSRIRMAWFAAGPAPALAPETHGSFEPAPGVVAERITYGTQFGMRIPAILYRPKSVSGKIPAFIVVNGHGGDKYSWYAFYSGILYARAGAAVLTYDPAGEGERNIVRQSGTRAHDKVEPPPELAQRLGGLMMTDIMQAVSYLAQRPEVDPRRIAAAGYSMGSFILGITGAVERRLKAVVLVGGGNLDGEGGYWENSKQMCQGIPYKSLRFLGDRPAVLYALHASRGATLVYNGLEDTTVAIPRFGERYFIELQERTAKLRGTPERVFETGFVPNAAHRPYFVTKPVALWLEKQLDFPNWTEESIRSMPETHISEWAAKHGIPMDKLYATEQREGGTLGLGTGVPGYKREDLSVFSSVEWERRKHRMIHETWVRDAKAAIVRAGDPLAGLRPGHPRLILLDSDLDRLRKLIARDPLSGRIYQQVRQEARKILDEPVARYELTNGRLLTVSRRAIDRMYTLGLMYRLDGAPEYRDRAAAELRAISTFPRWQDNFLDKAEMTHAAAIGYDWFHGVLSSQDRALVRRAIAEKGVRPALAIYDEQRWWAVNRFNWNPVCNGGVGLGALAFADEEPELARAIWQRLLRSFPLALTSYAPDGGWGEGPEYWHYATRYAVHLLSGMRSALGHDFELSASDGFDKAGFFRIHMVGPSGKLFAFGDSDEEPESAPEMFWLASRFKQPVYAWHQRPYAGSALDLIWYTPDESNPKEAQWPTDMYFRETEVATLRSSWTDPDAIYIGVKAGQTRGGRGHAQLDLGNFVLDAGRTRWAYDLGRDSYQLPDYFGKMRFTYFRNRTAAHNTLLIDHMDQDTVAEAPVFAHRFGAGNSYVRVDLSDSYPGRVSRFERGVALHDGRHVIVQDEVEAPFPVDALWSMMTDAEISLLDRSAALRKGAWSLDAKVLAPADAKFDIESASATPPQNPNEGFRRLVVRLPDRRRSLRLVVSLTPHPAAVPAPPTEWRDRSLDRW
jgi:dienelactone hydrolase